MRGIKPDAAVIAEALRCYEHEPMMTVAEIARRARVHREVVSNWAREAKLPRRPPGRKRIFTTKDNALAVRLYLQVEPVLTMFQIVAKTGMNEARIRAAVDSAGLPRRPVSREKRDYGPGTEILLDENTPPAMAARFLGVTPGTVTYHRKRNRVPREKQ